MELAEIKKYVQKIKDVPNHEEKQVLAVQGFFELFNAKGALLYNYSSLSKIGEGMFMISKKGRFPLNEIRADIRDLPPIYSSLRERKAKYIDRNLIYQIPRKYMVAMVPFFIVPIFNHSTVLGYVAIAKSDCNHKDEIHLNSLTFYGELLGKIFEEDDTKNIKNLNHREIEILQRLSWGESNKEIANYIGLSAFTVQDYIKSAMKKLGVQTRVEGVAAALRKGIIK